MYHIFGQYWYTKNVPVLTNTGTFQYLGPEVYFFLIFFCFTVLNRDQNILQIAMLAWTTKSSPLGPIKYTPFYDTYYGGQK